MRMTRAAIASASCSAGSSTSPTISFGCRTAGVMAIDARRCGWCVGRAVAGTAIGNRSACRGSRRINPAARQPLSRSVPIPMPFLSLALPLRPVRNPVGLVFAFPKQLRPILAHPLRQPPHDFRGAFEWPIRWVKPRFSASRGSRASSHERNRYSVRTPL